MFLRKFRSTLESNGNDKKLEAVLARSICGNNTYTSARNGFPLFDRLEADEKLPPSLYTFAVAWEP